MAKKDITNTDLVKIEPITDNQKLVFDSYAKGQHQFMFGSAGTGKTFISLYLALSEVLRDDTKYDKVVLVRSLIPTREIGFLPGDEEDKAALYQPMALRPAYQDKPHLLFVLQKNAGQSHAPKHAGDVQRRS